MRRSLVLRREALGELDPAELHAVAGGTHVGCQITHALNTCDACRIPTLPLNDCVQDLTSAFAATVFCIPPTNGC